jgi:hypothetical protein
MKRYWDAISKIEDEEYCMEGYLEKDIILHTDKDHPIYDENGYRSTDGPRKLKKEHWEQLEAFDTFPLMGQR